MFLGVSQLVEENQREAVVDGVELAPQPATVKLVSIDFYVRRL